MKKVLNGYTLVTNKACSAICYVSMIFIAAMMLIMFVDSMLGLFANYRITGIYELVQCLLLVIAASMVIANLCVDFAYGLLDPRLRQKRSQ